MNIRLDNLIYWVEVDAKVQLVKKGRNGGEWYKITNFTVLTNFKEKERYKMYT